MQSESCIPGNPYILNRGNCIECNVKCSISIPYEPCEHYPTDGNGPTQGQRKTLTRVGIHMG